MHLERPFDVTHRGVFAIAVPMTLAHLSTPLLGIVDTAVIGRLGQAHLLGGIAVGAVVFDILFSSFSFLRSGTTGLTAQALGAEDRTEQTAALYRAGLLGLLIGLAAIVLQTPILEVSLALMGASATVSAAMAEYFAIRIYSAPFALMNYAILGWFLGLGRAGTGLALQLLLNGLNIVLNATFVLVLGWGVAGVALGTLIAEAAAFVAGVILVLRTLDVDWRIPRDTVLDKTELLRTFAINRDILIRTFSLLATFALFTAAGARQGDIILAANAVLMHFFMVGSYFLDGMATAAEQLTGRAVGARHRAALLKAVKFTLVWGFVLGGGMSLVLLIFGSVFIDLLTTSPEVRLTARGYLIWAALTPLLGAAAFQFDGVFIGATWSDDMRNMMLISLAAFIVVWQVATPIMGNHGLWLAQTSFLVVRGATLALRYPVRLARAFP